MRIKNKTTFFLFCCLFVLVLIIILSVIYINTKGITEFNYLSKHKLIQRNPKIISTAKKGSEGVEPSEPIIPANFEIEVPFISQAPYGLWDELHEDACEEASFLMLYAWHRNQDEVQQDEAEVFIKEMVAHQTTLGYEYSITLKELAEIAENRYNLQGVVVNSVTSWQDIKEMLYYNRSPIIAGMSGKMLNNPNFRNGGPNYHMLVIIGYDNNGFITNDPGTKNGEKYYYTNETLFDALHDYNVLDINLGEKNIMYLASDL